MHFPNRPQWTIWGNPAFGSTACIQDFPRGTLVVPFQVKVQPGRSAIQLPQPRRNAIGDHILQFPLIHQTLPRSEPYALPVGVHFTEPVSTTAAGAVSYVFGTLRFRTKKRNVLDGAIAATLAFKQQGFDRILKHVHQNFPGYPAA